MKKFDLLTDFLDVIHKDPKISITHIGLYASLLGLWKKANFPERFEVYSHQVMPIAKISSSATYHKCIRELCAYGYIIYSPSFKKNQGSRIGFPDLI